MNFSLLIQKAVYYDHVDKQNQDTVSNLTANIFCVSFLSSIILSSITNNILYFFPSILVIMLGLINHKIKSDKWKNKEKSLAKKELEIFLNNAETKEKLMLAYECVMIQSNKFYEKKLDTNNIDLVIEHILNYQSFYEADFLKLSLKEINLYKNNLILNKMSEMEKHKHSLNAHLDESIINDPQNELIFKTNKCLSNAL